MIEDTQTIQGETGQPAPQTQTPQDTEDSSVQQTVDQQILESGTGTIRVPGASEQSAVVTEPTSTVPANDGAGFDIGLSLLIVLFVLALSLISLLAWTAIRHSKKQSDEEAEPTPTDSELNADQIHSEDGSAVVAQSKPSQKKLTRRQRRKAQQK